MGTAAARCEVLHHFADAQRLSVPACSAVRALPALHMARRDAAQCCAAPCCDRRVQGAAGALERCSPAQPEALVWRLVRKHVSLGGTGLELCLPAYLGGLASVQLPSGLGRSQVLGTCVQGVSFGVFGLGNKQYEHFCAVGKRMHRALAALGATPLVQRGEGDDDDDIEADFEAWRTELYASLDKATVMAKAEVRSAQAVLPVVQAWFCAGKRFA